MKHSDNMKTVFRTWVISSRGIVTALFLCATQLPAGHPVPYEHPAEFREANMVMLRFQTALAAERWQEAFSLCSDRVRTKAAEWPSLAAFFRETMPVEKVVNKLHFDFWQERHGQGSHFYGSAIRLTEPGFEPVIEWYWSLYTTNKTWVIDFQPERIVLEELIAKKKAEIQKRADRIKSIQHEVEPKLKSIKTHLTAVSESFTIGKPMLFRLELINFGDTPVHYSALPIWHEPLIVSDGKKATLPPMILMEQLPGRYVRELAPGSSAVLAEKIDLARNYDIRKPGKYSVWFGGYSLQIGKALKSGSDDYKTCGEFVAALGQLPSNVIEIEVKSGSE